MATTLHDVLARQQEVAREVDTYVVDELVSGTRGMPASRWEVALAAIVLVEMGRPKLHVCRQLGVHPRQLYRWWSRYRAAQPVIPTAAARTKATG